MRCVLFVTGIAGPGRLPYSTSLPSPSDQPVHRNLVNRSHKRRRIVFTAEGKIGRAIGRLLRAGTDKW